MFEDHPSGLLYFMPRWIFNHEKLTNTEKLLYALLSGLAHGYEEKTCFTIDEEIAKKLFVNLSKLYKKKGPYKTYRAPKYKPTNNRL